MTTSRAAMAAAPGELRPTAIDENHLGRMTLGDRGLEREVLQLFLRQTAIILDRIMGAEPPMAAAAAHTLKGSARGIGAWRVARAAESLERAAGRPAREAGSGGDDPGDLESAIAELKSASLEAGAAIAARLAVLLAELGAGR